MRGVSTTDPIEQPEREPFPPSAAVFLSRLVSEGDTAEFLRRADALAELVEHPGWEVVEELVRIEAAHQAAPRRQGMQLAAAIVRDPAEVATQIATGAGAVDALVRLMAVVHEAIARRAGVRDQVENGGAQ